MTFRTIRIELARTKEFPDGSTRHGYEFVLPIDNNGHIDVEAWRANKAKCTVRRFWGDAEYEDGYLVHTRRGSWAFSYAPGEEDDEPFFRFEDHVFKEGEYISLTGHDGELHPFKVVSVRKPK